MIISLKDFALTGKFGPISIGMQKEHVVNLLGIPDDDQDFGTGFCGIIYGWYEFFFESDDKSLHAIQNDHCCEMDSMASEFKNSHFTVEPWLFRSNPWHTLSSVQKHLRDVEIPFHLEDQYERKIVAFDSGVYLDFDDEGDDPETIGFRYFPIR